MVAVSQNLVLGASVMPPRAAAGLTSAITIAGNVFLRAFENVGHVEGVAESSNADLDLDLEQGIMPNVPDATDVEVRVELTPVDGAIWLPVAQAITSLPSPNTFTADTGTADLSAETETGVNAPQANLGTVERESAEPMLPYPAEDTSDQPLADPTFDHGAGVALKQSPANERMAATVWSPEGEASKPNTEFDPALQYQDAHKVTKQSPLAPPKSLAAEESIPIAPVADLTPTYLSLMAEGQFASPADQSKTPIEPLNDTYVDTQTALSASDIPVRKAWPDTRVSNVENAWRDKWAKDVPEPFENDVRAKALSLGAAINDVATPRGLFAAPSVVVSLAWQKSTNSAPGHAPLSGTILEALTADKSPKSPLPDIKAPSSPLPFVMQQDRSIQLADTLLETAISFEAGSFATSAATTPQPAINSFAPLLRSLTLGLPTAVSPIIVDLVRSGNDGPLELALSPEELGQLIISIKQDGDFVRVTLTADRPETLDLMRRHGGELVADLRQAGFSGASLSFGQGGQGQQPRFANAEPTAKNPPTPQHLPPETKPTASSRPRKGSGVDLRF